jgi:hypothetical protein
MPAGVSTRVPYLLWYSSTLVLTTPGCQLLLVLLQYSSLNKQLQHTCAWYAAVESSQIYITSHILGRFWSIGRQPAVKHDTLVLGWGCGDAVLALPGSKLQL